MPIFSENESIRSTNRIESIRIANWNALVDIRGEAVLEVWVGETVEELVVDVGTSPLDRRVPERVVVRLQVLVQPVQATHALQRIVGQTQLQINDHTTINSDTRTAAIFSNPNRADRRNTHSHGTATVVGTTMKVYEEWGNSTPSPRHPKTP